MKELSDKRKVDRPSGISRSTVNRDVIEVGVHGELPYYHTTQQMIAFCPCRADKHFEGCRKQITTSPQKRGSGRPIGALVCWLMEANKFANKAGHVHCAKATWQDRKNARNYFETLPGSDRFLKYEKPKAAREDAEPKTV